MRCLPKSSLFRPTIALVVLLATVGAASADILNLTIDQDASLLAGRTQATLTGTIECTATESASITLHIYQPTGRLLNIGIGTLTVPVTCTGGSDVWTLDVFAIPGLRFKSGPATAVAEASTATGTSEVGAKIKLKP
ncbi:MAG TPA: hypothetical protein VGL70_06770 [Candidatus Binatia bacterium]|jgi:hypothetical protein